MRTTVTLDPDTEQLLRRRMKERGVPFEQALNDALREALREDTGEPFHTPTFDLGVATLNLDRGLALAGELEDEERVRERTEPP